MKKYSLPCCAGTFLSVFLLSCSLEVPRNLQIIASPAIYLPLGGDLLKNLKGLNFDLSGLARLAASDFSGTGVDIRDYPGAYPDTLAFAVIMKLADRSLPNTPPNPGLLPPDTPIPVPAINLDNRGQTLSLDVSRLTAPLKDYGPLQFRSLPAYLYIDGPPSLFEGGNVKATLKVTPLTGGTAGPAELALNAAPVMNLRLPAIPPSGPITKELEPRPAPLAMTALFNARSGELQFEYEISSGAKNVPLGELVAHQKMSAHLVLIMPLQFVITQDMPIVVDPSGTAPANALFDITAGADLFGRGAGDSKKWFDSIEYLALEARVKNSLGLEGWVELNTGPKPAFLSDPVITLGKINLEGPSKIQISKAQAAANPFFLWARAVLGKGQRIDIKRRYDTAASPLEINLGVTVKALINQTF
ncbi:MAG: hypothetical protein LBQ35_02255 [Spirochaetaceae bacterium]|jgi:hypothetical protein|nr:hypothetical protein [Spirochaetaceae bacterium]